MMIGSTLAQRYRIEAEVARGGRGVIYRARDTRLERTVAIKVLLDTGLDPENRHRERERLLREAQSVARLNHPNIVAVYDADLSSEGQPFIVMEYVQGESLFTRRPKTLDETLSIARQLCSALEHAHSQGLIHRDLKPENVLLTGEGIAKLTDFGLARSRAAVRPTQEGTILGTVLYLAPEQALGQPADQRTDLYSLGVMLYELVTGRLPFPAEDPLAVISQHLYAPVVPPRAYNESLPPPLETLILRLLSKRPEDRPGSAHEVKLALENLVRWTEEAGLSAAPGQQLAWITRGRLVGRERELAEMRAMWQRVLSGESRVLVVSGESGIGKTRLVRELAAQVQVLGGAVLVGDCYVEGGAPYAPIIQWIQAAVELAGRELLAALPPLTLFGLATLYPPLATLFPDLPQTPTLGPQAEQQRLFESVAGLFGLMAQTTPLLVFLEDAHWGDRGTLFLLRHLARRADRAQHRLLFALTYREAELVDNAALSEVLVDLNHERLLASIRLPRLEMDQTRDLLEAMFAEEITPEFLDVIYRETEGNPFFIEEVCKLLIERGQLTHRDGRWKRMSMDEMEIPSSVRVAVEARLARLPSASQELLLLAAFIGREFDFDILLKASGEGEEGVITALEIAERAQIIGEARSELPSEVTYVFGHALIPMTLHEGVNALRRRKLHRKVAEAILSIHPDDYERLAYQFTQAGDLEQARHFQILSGDRARRLVDLEDALEHYRLALVEWPEVDPLGQAETLQKFGECQWLVSGPQSALPTMESAYTLFERAGARVKAGELQRIMGRMNWQLADRPAAMAHYQQAMEILEEGEETVELARAISSISQMYMLASRFDDAITWGERALALAERLGGEDVILHALNNIGSARCHVYEYDQERGLRMLRESLRRSQAARLPHDIARAALNLGEMLVSLGYYAEAGQVFAEGYDYFTRLHAQSYVELLLFRQVDLDWLAGRWAESLRRLPQLVESTQGVFGLWIRTCLAKIYNDLGRPAAAQQELEDALSQALQSEEAQTTVPYLAQLARAYVALGDEGQAVTLIEQYLSRIDQDPYFFWGLEKPVLFACQWYTIQAGRGLKPFSAAGEFAASARRCLERLERVDAQMRTGSTSASLAEGRGLLALCEKNFPLAAEAYRIAVSCWETLGQPLEQAAALDGLGQALKFVGDVASSRQASARSKELISALAEQIQDPELRISFEQSSQNGRLCCKENES